MKDDFKFNKNPSNEDIILSEILMNGFFVTTKDNKQQDFDSIRNLEGYNLIIKEQNKYILTIEGKKMIHQTTSFDDYVQKNDESVELDREIKSLTKESLKINIFKTKYSILFLIVSTVVTLIVNFLINKLIK